MSSWQTVSVKYMDDSSESFQRYTSQGKNPRIEEVMTASKGCCFDGDIFWLSHDVGNAYLLSVSDTSNMGSITNVFTGEVIPVALHNDSLYRHSYEGWDEVYHEDVLKELPDWVNVGGNWSYMDD